MAGSGVHDTSLPALEFGNTTNCTEQVLDWQNGEHITTLFVYSNDTEVGAIISQTSEFNEVVVGSVQNETKFNYTATQWDFTQGRELLGFWGNVSDSEITALSYLTVNQTLCGVIRDEKVAADEEARLEAERLRQESNQPVHKGLLKAGAIAGILIGVLVVVLMVLAVIICYHVGKTNMTTKKAAISPHYHHEPEEAATPEINRVVPSASDTTIIEMMGNT